MLSCRDVAERASDYLDRELSLWSRWQVRLHLFVCQDCRRYLDQLRELGLMVRAAVARGSAMDPAIEERLLATVRGRARAGLFNRDASSDRPSSC